MATFQIQYTQSFICLGYCLQMLRTSNKLLRLSSNQLFTMQVLLLVCNYVLRVLWFKNLFLELPAWYKVDVIIVLLMLVAEMIPI